MIGNDLNQVLILFLKYWSFKKKSLKIKIIFDFIS